MNFLYLFLAIAPSLFWLIFYLKKDVHPEPKRYVVIVFLAGIVSAIFALWQELYFKKLFFSENLSSLKVIIYLIVFVSFWEEILKYFAFRFSVLKNKKVVEEAVDLMIYMIVSALGFVMVENILVFWQENFFQNIAEVIFVSLGRFLIATFLHTITSGIFGYFLALSLIFKKEKRKFFFLGVFISSLLHTLYNLSIISIEGSFVVIENEIIILSKNLLFGSFLFLIILFFVSANFLFKGFKKLKENSLIYE